MLPTTSDYATEIRVERSGSADVLRTSERKLPPPGPGEVRVKIEAAGVAYADIVMRRGLYSGYKPPITPGYDFVGRVEAIGPDVSELSVGQRVAGMTIVGSYATRRNVEARWVVPAPAEVDAASLVAAVLNGVTAWQMFHRIANTEPGDWVLIHGAAGGVGSLLLDLARLAGINAIGVASKGKRDVVMSRGAEPIDYGSDDVVSRARAISGGGVIAAFDHIGGKHFKRVSMASLRAGGIGVLYGGYDATRDGKMHPLAIADLLLNTTFSGLKLFGSSQGVVGYSAPVWRNERTHLYRRDLTHVLNLVATGALTPLIGSIFPLADAAAAHRALEQRSVTGKIVLIAPKETSP